MWGDNAQGYSVKKLSASQMESKIESLRQEKARTDRKIKVMFCVLSLGYLLMNIVVAVLFALLSKTLLSSTSFGAALTILDMIKVYAVVWAMLFCIKITHYFTT